MSIINFILSLLINLFHLTIVLFITLTPFNGIYNTYYDLNTFKSILFYLFYIIISMNLMAHWYLNNQHCCLTALDNKLWNRPIYDNTGFVSQLLVPLFVFTGKPDDTNMLIWGLTILFLIIILSCLIIEIYRTITYSLSAKDDEEEEPEEKEE
jgi:amino acid transporter